MAIKINGTNTTASPGITGPDTDTGLVYGTDEVQVVTGGTTRATVDSSGRLLVGASSGGANLVVGDVGSPSFNRGAVAIKAVTDGNSLPANIYLEEASGAEGYTLSIDSDGDLNFHNSGAATPTVTFSDNNNVGIGETNPDYQLCVSDTGVVRAKIECTNNNGAGAGVYLKTLNSGALVSSATLATDNVGNFKIFTGTSSEAERLRILTSGGITFNGDTAAANALDDYEEGTFTFTVTQGVTSPTYNTTGGTYTKIGNCVTFTARMQVASGTVNGAQVRMGGLPFTTNSTLNAGGASFSYYGNINGSGEVPQAFIPKNDTIIILYGQDGGTWNGNSGNGLVNSILHIHGHYYV